MNTSMTDSPVEEIEMVVEGEAAFQAAKEEVKNAENATIRLAESDTEYSLSIE